MKPKPQPQKRLQSTKQLIQVKQEELTTWQAATGEIFAASLGVSTEVEIRSGKQLEAIFIQRYIRPQFPESRSHTMRPTFRARDTAMIGAGWEFADDEPLPDSQASIMNHILLRMSDRTASQLA